jgi:2-keto-4-pentenoate hydratase/2-oxohepta-3-ene-1,7-dioic acid hydratase in catechol pathway
MKIVRFALGDAIRFGILEDGKVYPCAGDPFVGLKPEERPLAAESIKLLSPIEPPNVICIGLNYKRHVEESKVSFPAVPQLFLKPTTAVCGPDDPIVIPLQDTERVDYEVELAIVIRERARHVPENEVAKFVLGYTIADDVSAREAQFSDEQWTRGKSFDSFCPLGPYIETDVDPDRLNLTCRVNGRTLQNSNTSDMIFATRRLVSFISDCMTLLPGTVILTGTPEGVGFARTPPIYLRHGDTVECEIESLGILRNPVVMESSS